MAGSIKGIIVEIGGDTSGLQKALKKVNSSTSSLSKELRGVNSLLKLDPKNTELVSQKQTILKQNIEQTSKKLEELRKAQEMADSTIASGGEISQENYRNLQREIINTESKLKQLQVEASKWTAAGRSIEEFGNKVSNISNKIDKMGITLTTRLTLPIAGMVTTAIASMDAVDEGLDTIATKTGATGAAAKELQEIYKEVASEVPGEFGDIGAAIGEINTRLDFTGDKLKTASVEFLKFAKVNGTDVNTSVQLVTRAMGDAGIKAEDYASLLDMLTVAGQKSGISIDALTTNLAKYGAPMRALGIDTKNAIAMFAGWEKAGVNTEIAFSGMKKAISNWGKAGKDSTKEFSNTLNEIAKCPDIAKATTKAIEVFGAKAGPDLADAIKGGRFEFQKYVEALDNGSGTLESTYKQIVDEVDDTQLAMQNAKIAMHDAGEIAAKSLGPALLDLSKKFKSLMERFDKLSDKEKKQILNIALMAAAIGPCVKIMGTLGKTIGTGTKALGMFSQAMAVSKNNATSNVASINNLSKAIGALSTPTGFAIAAFGTLTAVLITLKAAQMQEQASLKGLREEVENQKEAWNNLTETRKASINSSMTEISICENLRNELSQITDENGKVKEGYEQRAEVILNSLNKALGTEYKLNGNIINQYQDLKSNIDNVIASKKAEAVLNAYQEEYGTAIKEQANAVKTLTELEEQRLETSKKLATGTYEERIEAQRTLKVIGDKMREQNDLIGAYGKTITSYENLQKASAEGTSEAITKAIDEIGISYENTKTKANESVIEQINAQQEYVDAIKKSLDKAKKKNDTYQQKILENQLTTNEQQLTNLKNNLKEQTNTIEELTPEQIEAWKKTANRSQAEYGELLSLIPEETQKKIQEATGIVALNTSLSTQFGVTATNATGLFRNNLQLDNVAKDEITETSTALQNDTSVNSASSNLAQKANEGFNNHVDGRTWGEDLSENISSGMISKKAQEKVTSAATSIASAIKSILGHSVPKKGPLKNELTYMPDMIDNLTKGIEKNKYKITNITNELAENIKDSFELNNLKLPQIRDLGKLQGKLSREINSNTKNISNDNRNITFNIQGSNAKEIAEEINKIFGNLY